MEYSAISSVDADTHLSSVSFKLKKVDNINEETLRKNKFPVVIRPPTNNVIKSNHQFVNFTEQSSTVPTSLVYARQAEVARPRNKFIIARSVLSKPVKNIYKDNTDDVSKIISMIWKKHQGGNFQYYFQYLSFLENQWHESYFPLYHYHPKKKKKQNSSNIPNENFSSVVFMNDGDDLNSPEPSLPSSLEVAKDISDISKYVDLCSSTFANNGPNAKLSQKPKQNSYKDGALKFSINKVTKPKKPIKTASKKLPQDEMMAQYFKSFKSPMYGERAEDICFK